MKAASGRQIDRAGKFPFQKLGRITSPVRVRNKHRIDQKSCVWMKRILKKLLHRSGFADLSQKHDADPVRNMTHHREVVTDKQISQAPLRLQLSQQIQDLVLYRDVQGRNRFIADDQIRICRDGSRDPDPLPLSPRKLVGIAVEEFSRNADRFHQLQHPFGRLLLRSADFIGFQRLRDQIPDRHARIQGRVRILENQLEFSPVAAEFFLFQTCNRLSSHQDLPGIRLNQADQEASESGFAAARLSHKSQSLPFTDPEGYIRDRVYFFLSAGRKFPVQIPGFQQYFTHAGSSLSKRWQRTRCPGSVS